MVNMGPFTQLCNMWCYNGYYSLSVCCGLCQRFSIRKKKGDLQSCINVTNTTQAQIYNLEGVTAALTPLVVFAVLRISLHAVVQFHQDWLQARVHPLDQLVVHHQRPQQHAQN